MKKSCKAAKSVTFVPKNARTTGNTSLGAVANACKSAFASNRLEARS